MFSDKRRTANRVPAEEFENVFSKYLSDESNIIYIDCSLNLPVKRRISFYIFISSFCRSDKRINSRGNCRSRHCLKPYSTGSRHLCIEEALAAEQLVAYSLYALDIY